MTAKKPGGKKRKKPGQVAAKSVQGSVLPEDGSPLGCYPVGSCVFVDAFGEPGWYLVAFRLGGSSGASLDPHLRRLLILPSDPRWNFSSHEARQASEYLVVQGSCWPLRVADARPVDRETDPVAANLRLAGRAGSLDTSGSVTRSWGSG